MSESALRLPANPLSDVVTMIRRCLRLTLRNVDGLITALVLPVMLMLIFVYLFGGAIETGTAYVNYVLPGVLLVSAGFGVGATAVSVSHDLTGGIIDRFRSMDVRGEALLAGHVVASVGRNLVSTVLVFAVAFAIGFRRTPTPWRGWVRSQCWCSSSCPCPGCVRPSGCSPRHRRPPAGTRS